MPAQHDQISGATRRRGVLLVAQNGNRKIWDFWDSETDDFPFGAEALEGVTKNYPINKGWILVSGYSFGSAMAWRYICEDGNDVAALLGS